MVSKSVWVLLVLLALPLTVAAQTQITYILDDDSLLVSYDVLLENETVTFSIPEDATSLTVDGSLVEQRERVVLRGTGRTEISFFTAPPAERVGHESYLIEDLAGIPGTLHSVRVVLPRDARLVEDLRSENPSIRPRPTQATTDGSRLIFIWDGEDLAPANAFLLHYTHASSSAPYYFIAIIVAVALFGGLYVARRRRTSASASTKTDLTRNLFEDEKLLVEILLGAQQEGMWQKQLVKKSGMSKVKVSRKLRNLQAKGVIEKIPHGNTNRIRIKQ